MMDPTIETYRKTLEAFIDSHPFSSVLSEKAELAKRLQDLLIIGRMNGLYAIGEALAAEDHTLLTAALTELQNHTDDLEPRYLKAIGKALVQRPEGSEAEYALAARGLLLVWDGINPQEFEESLGAEACLNNEVKKLLALMPYASIGLEKPNVDFLESLQSPEGIQRLLQKTGTWELSSFYMISG